MRRPLPNGRGLPVFPKGEKRRFVFWELTNYSIIGIVQAGIQGKKIAFGTFSVNSPFDTSSYNQG
jgi:hypothetical protein